MSQSSLITSTIVLITVISQIPRNSAVMLKFRGKGQIPRLGSKFRGPRKTVGPSHLYDLRRAHLVVNRVDWCQCVFDRDD